MFSNQSVKAQSESDGLPAIIKNNGQLRNSNNDVADNITYYGKAGDDLTFWNNNFDLIFSKYTIDTSLALPISMHRVDLKFLNKDTSAIYVAPDRDHYLNYYLDESRGTFEEVGVYKSIKVANLYDKINLQYTIRESCDMLFTCFPGSTPSQLQFEVSGADNWSINSNGGYTFGTSLGDIITNDVSAYQEINGTTNPISINLRLAGPNYSFAFGNYDSNYPLYIVVGNNAPIPYPPLGNGYQNHWTTALGGNMEEYVFDNRLTGSNYLYICGRSINTFFPVIVGGSGNLTPPGGYDAFVVKFNPNRSIAWGIYYGGSGYDAAFLIDVDESSYNNNVLFTGQTLSPSLNQCVGCTGYFQTFNGISDAFIAKVNSQGLFRAANKSISTFFGGAGHDFAAGLTMGENGAYFISGFASADSYLTFPYLNKPFSYFQTIYKNNGGTKTNFGDGFIAKFDANNNLIWSTAVGGYDNSLLPSYGQELIGGLAFDSKNNLYATGYTVNSGLQQNTIINGTYSTGFFPIVKSNGQQFSRTNSGKLDAVVLKFDFDNALVWSTEFGGAEDDMNLFNTIPLSNNLIAINNQDEIFIAGVTKSVVNSLSFPDFPIFSFNQVNGYNQSLLNGNGTGNIQDGFVAKFNTSNGLIWSTYLGGQDKEIVTGISCRNTDKLFVTGQTFSTNFPYKSNVGWYSKNAITGPNDGFVTTFNNKNLNH